MHRFTDMKRTRLSATEVIVVAVITLLLIGLVSGAVSHPDGRLIDLVAHTSQDYIAVRANDSLMTRTEVERRMTHASLVHGEWRYVADVAGTETNWTVSLRAVRSPTIIRRIWLGLTEWRFSFPKPRTFVLSSQELEAEFLSTIEQSPAINGQRTKSED